MNNTAVVPNKTKAGLKRKEPIETLKNNTISNTKRKPTTVLNQKPSTIETKNAVLNEATTSGSPRKQLRIESIKKEEKQPQPIVPAPVNNNGFNPLDSILNEIDAFDTSNKPKKKKQAKIKHIKIGILILY